MRSAFAMMVVGLAVSGCEGKDKAKEAYDQCVSAYGNQAYAMAIMTCDNAVRADPTSLSGKAAQEKLPAIHAALDAEQKAATAKAGAAASAQVAATQAAVAKCTRWCVVAGPGVGRECRGGGPSGLQQCRDLEKLYVASPGLVQSCFCLDNP